MKPAGSSNSPSSPDTLWHLLGSGSIGTLAAARLLAAGFQVRVLPRAPTRLVARTLHRAGQPPLTLSLQAAEGETLRRVLVAVKAGDTRRALAPWLKHLAADATLVSLQNGLGTLDELPLGDAVRVVAAVTTDAAWRDGDQIRVVAENRTLMGDGSESEPQWLARLQPRWPGLAWTRDIVREQWRKLAVNAVINPLTALHRCRNGELPGEATRREAMRELAAEVDRVAAHLFGDWPADTLERSLVVARATAANTSSMLADVLAGRPTEIAYINGYLVRCAADLGLPVPANARIVERVLALHPH